jgi:hypothetical protein
MGIEFRTDDLSDHQIRVAVVKRLDSTGSVDGEKEGVVEGRFLALVDGFHKNARSQARIAEILDDQQTAQDPRLDKKEQRKQAEKDAWKKPLPNDIRAHGAGKDR